jgi:hypothetical protein
MRSRRHDDETTTDDPDPSLWIDVHHLLDRVEELPPEIPYVAVVTPELTSKRLPADAARLL